MGELLSCELISSISILWNTTQQKNKQFIDACKNVDSILGNYAGFKKSHLYSILEMKKIYRIRNRIVLPDIRWFVAGKG